MPFTERARRVVFFAQEEAGRLGENYVSTEHLLLGLVRENDTVAARILDRMGFSLLHIRSEIERQATRGDGRLGQDMQLTPRAKRVIDLAHDEVCQLYYIATELEGLPLLQEHHAQISNNYIGTEHLLLGLICEGEGLAGRVLAKLGVDLDRTRREVIALKDNDSLPVSYQKKFSSLSQCNSKMLSILYSLLPSGNTDIYNDDLLRRFPKLRDVFDGLPEQIRDLEEFWQFLLDHRENCVIALIGPVNVGKSTLGNQLLGREAFSVACVRETTCAQVETWHEHTVLVDLPGLGSVLADEDDAAVRAWVRRANVFLLILSVQQPVPRHFYDFLKDEISKATITQRAIVVLNKADTLGDIPMSLRQHQLDQIEKFLLDGNPKQGFRGIAELFPFDLPCIAMSTMQSEQENYLGELRNIMQTAQTASSDSGLERGWRELERIFDWLEPVLTTTTQVRKEFSETFSTTQAIVDGLIAEFDALVAMKFQGFSSEMQASLDTGMNDMKRSEQTNILQQITTTDSPEYLRKSRQLRDRRDRASERTTAIFDHFAVSLIDDFQTMCRARFGIAHSVQTPLLAPAHEAIKNLFYHVWDFLDDELIRGKFANDTQVESYDQKLLFLTQVMNTMVSAWIKECLKAINLSLKAVVDDYAAENTRLNEWGNLLEAVAQNLDYLREYLKK